MKARVLRVLLVTVAWTVGGACAQTGMYECVDANGYKRFTVVPSETAGCKELGIGGGDKAPVEGPAANVVERATDVLPFAQRFKGRFPSEIREKDSFDRPYRGRYALYVNDPHYDDSRQEISVNVGITVTMNVFSWTNVLHETCAKTGTGSGITAMGVRFSYIRRTCHVVELESDYSTLAAEKPIRFAGSPSDYRAIKARGLLVEKFVVPVLSNDAPVKYRHDVITPRLDRRYETDLHHYTVTGKIVGTRFYIPGNTKPLVLSQR
jgi:hypothetical protein